VLSAVLIATVLAPGCKSEESKEELEKVTLALEWAPNALHAFIVLGQEKGYFEDEGLEVETYVPADVETSARLVALGRAEFGITAGYVHLTAVGNEEMPLVVVADFQPVLPQGVQTMDPEIRTISDFKGRTFGVLKAPVERMCFRKLLATGGLTEDDVEIIDPGFNIVAPLLSGELDGATATTIFEQNEAERESGNPTRIYIYQDYGCGRYNFLLQANTNWVEDHEDTVRRFLKAFLKSLKEALEDENETMKYWIEKYPEFDADAEMEIWLDLEPSFIYGEQVEKGLGWTDGASMQQWMDLLLEEGVLEKPVSVEELYTNDYLPEEPLVPSTVDEILSRQAAIFAGD
jgi:putative hydroxymethylpyrimidine transport system substrate-binding protein